MKNDDTPETSAKLRDDIDHGKAGDKIGFPDPAAAPLGTDAEAGGHPLTKEQLRRAHEQEISDRPDSRQSADEARPVSPAQSGSETGRWRVVLAALGVILVLLIVFWTVSG